MVQRIEYAVFPDVREQELLPFVNKLLGHLQRTAPTSKDLREWLREQNAWDKELIPVALELLDVRTRGAKVGLGPWAQQMFAIDDPEAQKAHLYKRLFDENTLLCKYVLEALDSEGGGRLHSTHELHRMLTSYVYPGKHLRLTDFQAWIKWAVASGRIKLVGIRWGLTDLGKEAVPRLRGVDVDEFLEDEAAEGQEGADDAEAAAAPAPAAAPVVAAAAAPAAASAAGKAKAKPAPAAEGPPDEEGLDLPPEAPPIDESTFARYAEAVADAPDAPAAPPISRSAEAAAKGPSPREAKAAAAKTGAGADVAAPAAASAAASAAALAPLTRATTPPAAWVAHGRLEIGCLREPPDAGEAVARLRELGRQRGLVGGGSALAALGLEPRLAANEPARHLFLAALLARLCALRPDGGLAELLVERAGSLGPVAMLFERPDALAEVVVRWGFATPDVAAQQLRASLLDAVIGGRALAARPDLPAVLAETPQAEMLIGTLQQGLLRGAPATAAFWLVREMVRLGLWSRPAHTDIAAVPTRQLRLLAYRMRWIDNHFGGSTARLLELARRLATLLPPGSVEAAVAEQLAADEHLRFDCARLPICQEPCALHAAD